MNSEPVRNNKHLQLEIIDSDITVRSRAIIKHYTLKCSVTTKKWTMWIML